MDLDGLGKDWEWLGWNGFFSQESVLQVKRDLRAGEATIDDDLADTDKAKAAGCCACTWKGSY